VWIGSNDLRDALAALDEGLSPATVQSLIIEPAIAATAAAIQQLYVAGGRSFLVLNLPNVGDTPALRAGGEEVRAIGRQVSDGYNKGLDDVLDDIVSSLGEDIVILRFDVFAGLEELVQMPYLASLTNVEDSCITPGIIIGAICHPRRKYLFWDFIHPTKAAHAYLAEQAQALVETEFPVLSPVGRYASRM
jgi:phospholipase/lecithinase/hemolysin